MNITGNQIYMTPYELKGTRYPPRFSIAVTVTGRFTPKIKEAIDLEAHLPTQKTLLCLGNKMSPAMRTALSQLQRDSMLDGKACTVCAGPNDALWPGGSGSGRKTNPLTFDFDFAELETRMASLMPHEKQKEFLLDPVDIREMFKEEIEIQERKDKWYHMTFPEDLKPKVPLGVLKLSKVELMTKKDIFDEAELIRNKESKLSANERKQVMRRYEYEYGQDIQCKKDD